MKAILRNFNKPFEQKLIECNNISISFDQDGVLIESDNYAELFADLIANVNVNYKARF